MNKESKKPSAELRRAFVFNRGLIRKNCKGFNADLTGILLTLS
ncbi:hypothetical protein ELI_0728 [Eubacterium callanderi]|uniref:Uncharacterized protein n=1 Tax=Eubacterium callanderi TaxID=53442 RepID=E3GJA7_9FIRM|nr:hypothetical protein ELI_0728 [Eubacterium callanderi]